MSYDYCMSCEYCVLDIDRQLWCILLDEWCYEDYSHCKFYKQKEEVKK